MTEYEIIGITQETEFNREMVPSEVYVIKFKVKDQGPFSVSIPSEGYTASRGKDAVLVKAQEISATLPA